jgi:hypothetical protein
MNAILGRAQFVTVRKAAELTGYTVEEIQQRIDSGMWAEGEVWVWDGDSDFLINMQGYTEWAMKPGHALH